MSIEMDTVSDTAQEKCAKTSDIRLYHYFTFDRSLKIRWLLAELELKADTYTLSDAPDATAMKGFNAVSPFGYAPALSYNSEALTESAAIGLKLCRDHKPSWLHEGDIAFMQWLFFHVSSLDAITTNLAIAKKFQGEQAEIDKLEKLLLPNRLAALENHIRDKVYWYGEKFSLIDFFAWQNAFYLNQCGYLNKTSDLKRYLLSLVERPALKNLEGGLVNKLLSGTNR